MSRNRRLERAITENRQRLVREPSPKERALAWARETKAKFISAVGQEVYEERAAQIRSSITAISIRDGISRADAALKFEESLRAKLPEDQWKVYGSLVLVLGIEEFNALGEPAR